MTARRFALTPTKTPTQTSGDDRPRGACMDAYEHWEATRLPGDEWCYDLLIDPSRNSFDYMDALAEAVQLCRSCPLFDACKEANSDERWMRTVVQHLTPKPTTAGRNPVAQCGTNSGYYRHTRTLKEPACDECKRARAEDQARWKATRNRGAA